MGTIIILLILAAAIVYALKGSKKHFKGEGGCCGGSDSTEKVKKQKLNHIVATKTLEIEGMTCDNCRKRVENALNSLDYVNAKVSLKKKQAVIKMGVEITDEELKAAVEDAGYRVVVRNSP